MHIFYEQHQKRQLNAQLSLAIAWAMYKRSRDVRSHYFQYQRLDILIVNAFDITIFCLHIEFF